MRITMKAFLVLIFAALISAGCRDKDAEKRIAELEDKIKKLEGTKTADGIKTTVTPDDGHGHDLDNAAANKKPEGPLPVAVFNGTSHDFGVIKEGDVVEHVFSVKNTGEAPLIIENARPSCGCTVPDWTKTPIPPGGTGFVKAKFDSSGKPGMQNKNITVSANTWPAQTVLRFTANVTPKPNGENGPLK
jgi:hypothetical protein